MMAQSEEYETLTFIEPPTTVVGEDSVNSPYGVSDSTLKTDLGDYLKRPVRINTTGWLESATIGPLTTINPWSLWANNLYVKKKLDNYAFMRGDLHVKIVITASPFYYGNLKVIYQPLPNLTPTTISDDGAGNYLIPFSQRKHIDIYPQDPQTYEMKLPFIYNRNWLNVQSAADVTNMGLLDYIIYADLQSANGVTGTGVSVITYAWMDNLTISGASAGFSMQSEEYSNDEYGQGVVSKPASAIASFAGYFEKIPFIGKFATATKIGASAISSIASMFGFTNVPVISNTEPIRSEPFPKFSSSEISYPIEKLTLDPKNELTVDPRVVGLPDGTDEMMIPYLAGKESFLMATKWTTSNLVDDILFYSRVNPRLYNTTAATNNRVYMTPMCWISRMFGSWRGDIIFRFKVITSKYHKGTIRIIYDPTGYAATNIVNTPLVSNVVHTAVIDIGITSEVEFRVPYQQATQFLAMRSSVAVADRGFNNAAPSPYPYDRLYDNGVIILRVLNVLTAPVASSDVQVQVYVRAADNIEFGSPSSIDTSHKLTPFAPQSEEYSDTLSTTKDTAKEQYTVHFGENIRSIRQLIRRYEYHSTNMFTIPTSASHALHLLVKHFYRMPTTYGYTILGTESATTIVAPPVTTKFNFCQTTYLSWLCPAFVAYRGSINWSFNTTTPDQPINSIRVLRNNTNGYASSYNTFPLASTSASVLARSNLVDRNTGATGQALTNGHTQTGMNVQCPNYSNFSFQTTNPLIANQGIIDDGSILECYTLEMLIKTQASDPVRQVTLDNFVAAGTDFSLHYFLNVPTYYNYSTIPPGV
nr:MAG: hypothetical protein 2 [Marnaviridae sp.]